MMPYKNKIEIHKSLCHEIIYFNNKHNHDFS